MNTTQSQPFDIDYAYTTYLVENVRGGDPAAKGLYVTMYGPDEGTVVPQSPLVKESFTHGMWLPSYMLDSKKAMHAVQGSGWLSGLSNAGTNLYFSGNNLSFDSVEGGSSLAWSSPTTRSVRRIPCRRRCSPRRRSQCFCIST